MFDALNSPSVRQMLYDSIANPMAPSLPVLPSSIELHRKSRALLDAMQAFSSSGADVAATQLRSTWEAQLMQIKYWATAQFLNNLREWCRESGDMQTEEFMSVEHRQRQLVEQLLSSLEAHPPADAAMEMLQASMKMAREIWDRGLDHQVSHGNGDVIKVVWVVLRKRAEERLGEYGAALRSVRVRSGV